MIAIQPMFTRSLRGGIWDLNQKSFCLMFSFFWVDMTTRPTSNGIIYHTKMPQLPFVVLYEFKSGNFVGKGSDRKCSQISPDQAQK